MEAVVFPLATVASLVLIALAYRRFRGVPISKGFVSAAFGFVAFTGAAGVFDWAGDDAARLTAVLVLMVAAALFLAVQIARHRVRRGRPEIEPDSEPDDRRLFW